MGYSTASLMVSIIFTMVPLWYLRDIPSPENTVYISDITVSTESTPRSSVSLTLQDIINKSEHSAKFHEFLQKEFALENLMVSHSFENFNLESF